MNSGKALAISILCLVPFFFLGPVALLPMAWWLVHAPPANNNYRTFGAASLNVTLLGTILISIFIAYLGFALYSNRELINVAEWLASFTFITVSPARLLVSKDDIAATDAIRLAHVYFIYLASLAIFTANIWLVLTRLYATQYAIRKRLNSDAQLSQSRVLFGIAMFGTLVVLFYWVLYFNFPINYRGRTSSLHMGVIYACCWIMIAIVDIAFWNFAARYFEHKRSISK